MHDSNFMSKTTFFISLLDKIGLTIVAKSYGFTCNRCQRNIWLYFLVTMILRPQLYCILPLQTVQIIIPTNVCT